MLRLAAAGSGRASPGGASRDARNSERAAQSIERACRRVAGGVPSTNPAGVGTIAGRNEREFTGESSG
jgi:hypothetical protein